MHYQHSFLAHPALAAAVYPAMNPYLNSGLFNSPWIAQHHTLFIALLLIVIIWTLIWKGIALWKAARNHQTAWFVIMLILNTFGILEIVYLLFFRLDRNAAHATVVSTTTATTSASSPSASDSSSTPGA